MSGAVWDAVHLGSPRRGNPIGDGNGSAGRQGRVSRSRRRARSRSRSRGRDVSPSRRGVKKETITKWVNCTLAKGGFKPIRQDICKEICDGVKLMELLAALTGNPVPKHRSNCTTVFQKLDNMEIAMRMVHRAGVDAQLIHNQQLVDGDSKIVLGLMWQLFQHFQLFTIKAEGGQEGGKAGLLKWVRSIAAEYPEIKRPVNNFDSDWADGKVLCAIVDRSKPGAIDFTNLCSSPNTRNRIETALSIAEKILDVPRIVESDEFLAHERSSVIMYVAELYHSIRQQDLESREGDRKNQIADVQANLARVNADRAALASKLDEATRAGLAMQKRMQELQTQLKSEKSRTTELSSANARLKKDTAEASTSAQAHVESLRRERSILVEQLEAAKAEARLAADSANSAAKAQAELQAREKKMLTEQLAAARAETKRALDANAELKCKEDDCARKKREIQDALTAARADANSTRAECTLLAAQIKTLSQSKTISQQQQASLQAQLASLQTQLALATSRTAELNASNALLKDAASSNSSANSQVEALQREKKTLSEELAAAKAARRRASSANEIAVSQIEVLQREKRALLVEVETARAAAKRASGASESVKSQMESLERDKSALQLELTSAKTEAKLASRELAAAKAERKSASDASSSARARAEALEREKKQLSERLAASATEATRAMEALTELKSREKESNGKNDRLHQALDTVAKEAESLRADKASLSARIKALSQNKNASQEHVASLEAHLASLQTQLESEKSRVTELSTVNTQLKKDSAEAGISARAQVESLLRENSSLTKQLEAANAEAKRATNSAISSEHVRLESLMREKSSLTEQLATARAEANQAMDANAKLKCKEDDCARKKRELQNALDAARADAKSAIAELGRARETTKLSQVSSTSLRNENEHLKQINVSLAQRIAALERKLAHKRETDLRVETALAELERAREAAQLNQTQNAALVREKTALAKQVLSMKRRKSMLVAAESRAAALAHELKSLRKAVGDLESLRDQNSGLKESLNHIRARDTRLRTELSRRADELRALRSAQAAHQGASAGIKRELVDLRMEVKLARSRDLAFRHNTKVLLEDLDRARRALAGARADLLAAEAIKAEQTAADTRTEAKWKQTMAAIQGEVARLRAENEKLKTDAVAEAAHTRRRARSRSPNARRPRSKSGASSRIELLARPRTRSRGRREKDSRADTKAIDSKVQSFLSGSQDLRKLLVRDHGNRYRFGSHLIHLSIVSGEVMVRVGGGYVTLSEFCEKYKHIELLHLHPEEHPPWIH